MADWLDKEMEKMKKRFKWDFKELEDFEKGSKTLLPLANISNKDQEVVVKIRLPDVISKEDIKLKISSDNLEVRAKKKKSVEVKKKKIFKKEQNSERYYRSLRLPIKVNHKKAVVYFKQGLLTVRLMKK